MKTLLILTLLMSFSLVKAQDMLGKTDNQVFANQIVLPHLSGHWSNGDIFTLYIDNYYFNTIFTFNNGICIKEQKLSNGSHLNDIKPLLKNFKEKEPVIQDKHIIKGSWENDKHYAYLEFEINKDKLLLTFIKK
jgi:hypothetical protein